MVIGTGEGKAFCAGGNVKRGSSQQRPTRSRADIIDTQQNSFWISRNMIGKLARRKSRPQLLVEELSPIRQCPFSSLSSN
jgi:hypothetical protein